MHTIVRKQPTAPGAPQRDAYRKPFYDLGEEAGLLRLRVFVPGADPSNVTVEARGQSDLVVTAPKARFVRVNWQSLHLEGSQRDYRLTLRLGRSYSYESMQAEIHDGVLTITLPQRSAAMPQAGGHRLRRVA